MAAVGLTTWVWENRLKTTLLVLVFPILLFAMVFVVLFLVLYFDPEYVNSLEETTLSLSLIYFKDIVMIGIPVLIIWFFCSIYFHKKIIFSMSGAVPVTRKEMPEIYNIVENLCVSRGLPMPQVAIMKDSGLNAFATGWNPEKSWIVFSKGLIEKLDKKEIEAVAAHELTHIINRDVKLMTMMVVFIGILGTLGYILFRFNLGGGNNRSEKSDNKLGLILLLLGISLYVFSFLIFPLIRLAISRKREFLADAGAVELTKDNKAMISALQKISGNSVIEKMQNKTLSAMCIESPKKKKKLKSWFSSHPTIDERISALSGENWR